MSFLASFIRDRKIVNRKPGEKFHQREGPSKDPKMASVPAIPTDSWYLSLLGIAESFRTASPPKIKHCIHCLQSIFHFKPPPRIEARTHVQLGSLLFTHTKNVELARTHLEKAVSLIIINLSIGHFVLEFNPSH